MKPISIPTTKEEMLAIEKELLASHYFANASEDSEEIDRANSRITECERAIDAANFYLDEEENVVYKT